MRSFDLTISFTSREEDGTKYLVQIYEQPLYRWLIAWVYHWYDMHIFKVPGFRRFDRWYTLKTFKGAFPHLSISDKQDIKCAWLTKQDKVILATLEVDEETYVRMGGRALKT